MQAMEPLADRVKARLQRGVRRTLGALYGYTQPPGANPLLREKLWMIRRACRQFGVRSFADLGGVWGVEGGYTFYALDRCPIDRALLVDTDFTDLVRERAAQHPQLTLVPAEFGSLEAIEQVGRVDAVFLFDVLLHQVAPDWDEVLRRYAEIADVFLIFNQQYTGARTVRFLDLGEEEFFRHVPHSRDDPEFAKLFEKLDEIHPKYARPYRDIHNIWQWGIVATDLERAMSDLGFEQVHHRRCGRWPGLAEIENQAFMFRRRARGSRTGPSGPESSQSPKLNA